MPCSRSRASCRVGGAGGDGGDDRAGREIVQLLGMLVGPRQARLARRTPEPRPDLVHVFTDHLPGRMIALGELCSRVQVDAAAKVVERDPLAQDVEEREQPLRGRLGLTSTSMRTRSSHRVSGCCSQATTNASLDGNWV